MKKRANQSSAPAPSSPYFRPREWDQWVDDRTREIDQRARESDAQRIEEIDRANAERAASLSPTPGYGWERQRSAIEEKDARIKALERALATSERTVARQAVTIRSYRRQHGDTLEGVIYKALSVRVPKLPAELLREVSDDFGDISARALHRVLAELEKAGNAKRVTDGWLKVKI